MFMQMPLAVGIENYKELIDRSYYYIDKTLIIKELLDQGGKVNLFARPRRFGKTLALSMIRTFFEKEIDENGEGIDNSHYFQGKKIIEAGAAYTEHLGQYPVISLSLKSAKQPDFETAYEMLRRQITEEYDRHKYVLHSSEMNQAEHDRYRKILLYEEEPALYADALKFLSDCLKKYHKKNVIILIDEYDVPLENAWLRGFYDQMVDFTRSLLESALKSNDSLERGIITGCLRISKESIFTGLNNLEVISVLNENYAEYFGFTQDEVEEMLRFYSIEDKAGEMKQWYNGYLFGDTEVYNPWSVVNYVKSAVTSRTAFPKPYWSNTSSNSIIRDLVEHADAGVRKEIEILLAGGSIEKPVHEDITYEDIHKSQDNLWNFLFFTGYLRAAGQRLEEDTVYLTLRIPNREVRYIYRSTIQDWFGRRIKTADLSSMYQAMTEGDSFVFAEEIKKQLRGSISYYDKREDFYHGFLLGLLSSLQDYEIVSNRESGQGRPDILLKPYDELMPAVIIELKFTEKLSQMEAMCSKALMQIKEKDYAAGLQEEGYKTILKYGICFCKKSCMVKCG